MSCSFRVPRILLVVISVLVICPFYALNNDNDCDSELQIVAAEAISKDGELHHTLTIVSTGCDIIDHYRLYCHYYNSEHDQGLKVYQQTISTFDFKTVIQFSTKLPTDNYFTIKYEVVSLQSSDSSSLVLFYNDNALPVVINEIMYRTTDNIRKWVEIYVNSRAKYLENMFFVTQREVIPFDITESDYILITNTAADAQNLNDQFQLEDIPVYTGLSNLLVAGEELTLKDPSGNTIERFTYDPDWSNERNVSIERINPQLPAVSENWGPSIAANGATPGTKNSIYTELIPTKTRLQVKPNPFSPYRDEYTIISYEFPERLNRVTCRIFDLKGRTVRKLINQDITAAHGSIIWDGKSQDGSNLPSGVYVITIQAAGYDTDNIYSEKTTAIIGI